ncbi:MAG: HEAT repeat domain-containing protein [Acidimicrobiales bacterium]
MGSAPSESGVRRRSGGDAGRPRASLSSCSGGCHYPRRGNSSRSPCRLPVASCASWTGAGAQGGERPCRRAVPRAGLRGAGDPDPAVRAQAAGLLAAVAGVEAEQALLRLIHDPSEPVRVAATRAWGWSALGHWPLTLLDS